MFNNIFSRFTLENGLAAVSADIYGSKTLATNGTDCLVWELDNNGNRLNCISTARPYRRLRKDEGSCLTTALGCCGDSRIYIIDDNYNEIAYITPEALRRNGCDSYGYLNDISVTCIGSETFFVGAFDNGAFLFDTDGKRLTRLCTVEKNEILTDFISLGNGVFAMSTLCGSTRIITVSYNGTTHSGILSAGHTLRMLIPEGTEIYGLFGKNYIYNRIIKIYSNGVFSLPE